MRISVVIPMLNEEGGIAAALVSARSPSTLEVIAVDGGSGDASMELARGHGAAVLTAPAGRARQMNAGAAAARGDILLFLHADTRLPAAFDAHVQRILCSPGAVAGAFLLGIDSPRRSLRLVERAANWRSRKLGLPYGDQAIFLRTGLFHSLGGYAEIPIMEDFELVRRLRRQGPIGIAPVPVVTSGRRWLENGVVKTTLVHQVVVLAWLLGVDACVLSRWYHETSRAVPVGHAQKTPPGRSRA